MKILNQRWLELSIISQLNEIYYREYYWAPDKLDEETITRYNEKILNDGLLITVLDGDVLCGYTEFWRLNFEQFGRIVCGHQLSPFDQDLQTGFIAYVANVYIRPEYRRGSVIKDMRNQFFKKNEDCIYFCGHAIRKKTGLIKVFTKDKISVHKEKVHGV